MAAINTSPYRGSAQITREQFLFYEMRTTAKLLCQGMSEKEVVQKIVEENLFQYPTEKLIKRMARSCIKRLRCLEDPDLVREIADGSQDTAKQICLYAMMKQYRLVWDFMVTVIGEKYRVQDFSFSQRDVNVFFLELQEQDDYVAGWSEATFAKIRQVLIKILVENEYLDNRRSDHINPVLISQTLENAIREKGETSALAAFNCFS